MLNQKVTELVKSGSKEQRVYACEKSFPHFCYYYFTEYFTKKSAPFHWDFFQDCQDMVDGKLKEVAWIAFRESAKTSVAKLFILWCILYKKKHYINYDSYDKSNSESALFDIAINLQSNKKILADFGQVYYPSSQKTLGNDLKETKIKRISNFITETGVKVEAFSTQEPIRGRIFKNFRPDLVVLDDIESAKTKDSYPTILKIKEHVNEMRAGLPEESCVLYLGNYITEDGVISYVMDILKDRKNAIVRNIPVIIDGKPSWPDKYVLTDAEAMEIAKTGKKIISLEEKRRDLTNYVFEAEMMNNPAMAGDNIFDRNVIEARLKSASEPITINAGVKIWSEYNASQRYAIGADTSEGVGRDSCASCVINFSTRPARVVATYANNTIPPDVFGYELIRQGQMYGECLIGAERNNTGYGTIAILQEGYPEYKLYKHTVKDKITNEETTKIGWQTNLSTKSASIYELKSAIENGELETFDRRLLEEMKHYQIRDVKTKKKEGMTRHFDLLMACAIAWQMRDFVSPPSNPQQNLQILQNRQERKNEYYAN